MIYGTQSDMLRSKADSINRCIVMCIAMSSKRRQIITALPAAWVTREVHQSLPKPKGLPITLVLDQIGKLLQAEKGQMFAEDVAQRANWLPS